LAFAPTNPQLLVSGAYEPEVHLWDLTTQECVETFSGHSESAQIRSVAVSPLDSAVIASGGSDDLVFLWRRGVVGGQRCSGHGNSVNAVQFSPHQNTVISCSADKSVRTWDVDSGVQKDVWQGHEAHVTAVAFSPCDPNVVATAARDRSVRIWDLRTGSALVLQGPSSCLAVAFSPFDSDLLLAVGESDISIWQLSNTSVLNRFVAEPKGANQFGTAQFSPFDADVVLTNSCLVGGGFTLRRLPELDVVRTLQWDPPPTPAAMPQASGGGLTKSALQGAP